MDGSNNSISNRLPYSLGKLARLRVLKFGHNGLRATIPDALGMCKSLVFLELQHNELVGPIPASFGALEDLTSLVFISDLQSRESTTRRVCITRRCDPSLTWSRRICRTTCSSGVCRDRWKACARCRRSLCRCAAVKAVEGKIPLPEEHAALATAAAQQAAGGPSLLLQDPAGEPPTDAAHAQPTRVVAARPASAPTATLPPRATPRPLSAPATRRPRRGSPWPGSTRGCTSRLAAGR